MTSNRKRVLIIISIVTFLFFWSCEEFFRRKVGGFAGSYPFVEYWYIKGSEQEVVDAIVELKKEKPEIQVPNRIELISKRDTGYIWTSFQMQMYLERLKTDSLIPLPEKTYENYYHDYWLYTDFYYQDTREVVHAWIRPSNDTTITAFAFVSLSKIDNPNDYRLINRDFWYIPNKLEIRKFEKTFVDRIQEKIDKKKAAHNN
jgi:hypothetical protein